MASLLQSAKNILSGKDPNTEPQASPDNRKDRVDQVKVIWYQWSNELAGDSKSDFGLNPFGKLPTNNDGLAKCYSYDISNHIESVSYTKNMGAASGSFSITLQNSFDWSRFMRPGQWLLVFFTGDGDLPMPKEDGFTGTGNFKDFNSINKLKSSLIGGAQSAMSSLLNAQAGGGTLIPLARLPLPEAPSSDEIAGYKDKLRVMGIISRVGVKAITTGDGVPEVSYSITGKDFGTIYEETELWFNANNADKETAEKVLSAANQKFSRNLTELLRIWHEIFLNPNTELKGKGVSNISTFFPEQWVLPAQMIDQLQLELISGATGYFGEIQNLKEFNSTLFENPDPNPLAGLEGYAWNRLKSLSQPEFHELFTELSDSGNPKIIFRPIPWAFDKSRYPTLGKAILNYADLINPDGALAPTPVGFNLSSIPSFDSLASFTEGALNELSDSNDSRVNHLINLSPVEVESFDVGPDYHNRYNFFLVSVGKAMLDQQNAFATVSALGTAKVNFPLRDENDIKRHGFKPLIASVNTFIPSNASLFGKSPLYSSKTDQEFILQVNEMMRDYHANAEDMYSGTLAIVGKPQIKLGKVIVTDTTFRGIADMVFYIEGYTDNFYMTGDGTGNWTQNVNVTRGIQKSALDGGSTKDKSSTQTGSFNTFNKEAKNASDDVLTKVKSFLK